jgi:hypothetical protein
MGRVQVLSLEGDKQQLIAEPKPVQQQEIKQAKGLERKPNPQLGHQQEAERWTQSQTKPQQKHQTELGKLKIQGVPDKKPESKQS